MVPEGGKLPRFFLTAQHREARVRQAVEAIGAYRAPISTETALSSTSRSPRASAIRSHGRRMVPNLRMARGWAAVVALLEGIR